MENLGWEIWCRNFGAEDYDDVGDGDDDPIVGVVHTNIKGSV